MSVSRRLLLAALGLAVCATTVQAGEVYKSVDANGNVVYSDHVDETMSHTTTVQVDDARPLPSELHFCWTNCFTLTLDHGVYRRVDGTDENWTVETFSPQALVLHRHDAPADWNGYSQDVIYAGQIANDRLIGVTVNGKPTGGIDASWGSALNTLPANNAERDSPNTENPNSSSNAVVKSATAPPPPPEEDQPPLVQDGYLWTPGYWYWRAQAYVWMPGAWASPPQIGFLWTPAYWSRVGAVFVFHTGHWGATVGYYGGINYGHGYGGDGFVGGHWIGNSFAYNSAVNHVDPTVAHHTYAESVTHQSSQHVSSYAAPSRTGGVVQTMPRQAPPPAAAKAAPPMTTVVKRTNDTAPPSTEVNQSAAVKTPTPSTPPKLNRAVPAHAVPAKQ